MALQVTIDQAGKAAGVAGFAREDLSLGSAVTLTASGGSTYVWTLDDAPPDVDMETPSSAVLSALSGAVVHITPDNQDTYLGTVTSDGVTVQWSFYAGPTLNPDPTQMPRRIPAWREKLSHNVPDAIEPTGNTKGWAREWRRWFTVLRTLYAKVHGIELVVRDIALASFTAQLIDSRPVLPTGPNRWLLVSITLRLKVAETGTGTPTLNLRIGSTSGGQEIVLDQLIATTNSVGDIVGGFAIASLGSGMSSDNGFQAVFPASQALYAKSIQVAGTTTGGIVTATMWWQAL